MYRVDRNNFYTNEKKASIYTPEHVSDFLYKILKPAIKSGVIFDPCVGAGSLLKPWKEQGWETIGVDIEPNGEWEIDYLINYLELTKNDLNNIAPVLIIMNPPFNIDQKTSKYIKEHYEGRPLLPEIWLQKAIELFGKDTPIVMFTPYGFRLNQTVVSKRWQKFLHHTYPEISSIISLPKNIFKNVLFHSEILIFNIKGLKPHYFLGQE
ncbi:N-6 DNA methylase [Spiroplasma chrysopicola]|uniref:Putative R/M system DNA methylase n=1 Tax=Spiroplasma chrysopicola DF-1 TaxID=1276227 RepID=R4UGJ8_9MOLU|nr:N-6 DNA methylase [Spiroplasma chrysopicola]AGM25250.1 putative R/M system DNA methylase [Spiroplasma chrysopicola DF-1]